MPTASRYLEDTRGAPLGALPYARYDEHTLRLAPDSVVVMYTDGLVERRDRTLGDGMDQLAAAIDSPDVAPEDVCDTLFAVLVDDATTDDVALLVARASQGRGRVARAAAARRPDVARGDAARRARVARAERGGAARGDRRAGRDGRGVRERRRARVRAGRCPLRGARDVRRGDRRGHGARLRSLAAAARPEPRPRNAADAGADGHVRGREHQRRHDRPHAPANRRPERIRR